MKIIEYILEVIICSGLFLVLYRWLLAGKVSYRICRIYIIGTMLLAAVIPALDVPLYPPAPPSLVSVPADISDGTMPDNKSVLYSPGESTAASITDSTAATETVKTGADVRTVVLNIITAVYCLTAAASIALIVLNMIKIRRLRRSARLTPMEDWALAESGKVQTPFSFLRTVYMGFTYAPSERLMILTHEISHVRHRHSYEKLALSVLRSLLWFNPFLWMAEKDLREVQEWEADRDVLDKGNDLTLYRTAIFKQLFGYNPDISSGLNHSLTKKRFIMMTKTQLGRYAFL
ncbi:MAG TPA: M48 family metalloprotease, partial [Candidatus Coprenecus stercoravium]|nr:M48 family metalloprotease [Candidatus Coprenecus stercoravium]